MGTFRQETLFGRWCGSVTAGGSKEFLASPSARTMHKESCLTQDAPPPAIWCKAAPSENRLAAIWEDALSPKTSPKVCVQSHLAGGRDCQKGHSRGVPSEHQSDKTTCPTLTHVLHTSNTCYCFILFHWAQLPLLELGGAW